MISLDEELEIVNLIKGLDKNTLSKLIVLIHKIDTLDNNSLMLFNEYLKGKSMTEVANELNVTRQCISYRTKCAVKKHPWFKSIVPRCKNPR